MNVAEIVTNKIIEQLQAGVAPWRKPWATAGHVWASNLISKRPYNGVNQFLLQMSGYSSPYWLTYKQAASLGGNVRKGEKGTPIIFVGRVEGKKTDNDNEKTNYSFLRYFTVFNVEQCENLDKHLPKPAMPKAHNKIEAAEQIVVGFDNRPTVIAAGEAWYRQATDTVGIPDLSAFESADAYYATLFHEFAHSTGHVSRLDRKESSGNSYGSELYGKEELIAELASAFLCNKAGIDSIPASASYCKSWITTLKGDAKLVISAAAAAQKAFEHIAKVPAVAEEQQQEAA